MTFFEKEINELEAKISALDNKKKEIERVFSELERNDLKDAVLEFYTFTYIPHKTELSGWVDFLTDKISFIMGKEIDSNIVSMCRCSLYKEAAIRFCEMLN